MPPPVIDEAAGAATTEIAVLAGGCFWGVQGVFQHVEGVTRRSRAMPAAKGTADYDTVSRGTTEHAEAVQITFDPRDLLRALPADLFLGRA